MSDFKDKISTLNFGTRSAPRERVDPERDTRTVEVLNEDTGEVAGLRTDHGSGRVDANVFARAAKAETQGAI